GSRAAEPRRSPRRSAGRRRPHAADLRRGACLRDPGRDLRRHARGLRRVPRPGDDLSTSPPPDAAPPRRRALARLTGLPSGVVFPLVIGLLLVVGFVGLILPLFRSSGVVRAEITGETPA